MPEDVLMEFYNIHLFYEDESDREIDFTVGSMEEVKYFVDLAMNNQMTIEVRHIIHWKEEG